MEKNLVIGIGEALWDVLPDGRKLGGAPANFAFHVGNFGHKAMVVSAVGADALGSEIKAVFAEKGVEFLIPEVEQPTGTVAVTLSGNGIPQYEICENVAWDNIPFTPQLEEVARHTVAVCFGSLAQRSAVSRETINRFLDVMMADATPEGQPLVVFDINLRQHFYSEELLHNSLTRCNILKINDEELDVVARMFSLTGSSPEEQCRELLHRYHLRMVILTCGTIGSYVFTPDETSFQPTPRVEVADTVGAGDSFTATFIASLLRGLPVADAHRRAVAVSAYVCTCHGAMPTLPAELKG